MNGIIYLSHWYANSVNIFKNGIDAYFSDNGRI